jgi:beta-galactosidase GanA
MRTLTRWLLAQSHVTVAPLLVPDGVEASTRVGKDRMVHILVNFADKEVTVHLPSTMKDEMYTGHNVQQIVLPVSGVAVLSEPR